MAFPSLDPQEFKASHGYDIEDTWYPRVTKIVDIKAKPALYRYYGDAPSFAAAKAATERSAEEGTLIHTVAEKIFIGEPTEIPEAVKPAITALQVFLAERKIQVQPEHVEMRILNKEHRYAGTIDTLATIDGKFGVLDIKTSQSIYRDYNLQTAAYVGALVKEFPHLITRWILRIDQIRTCDACSATLRPKGGQVKIRRRPGSVPCYISQHVWGPLKGVIELKEIPSSDDDFGAFLAAKRLWEWENQELLQKIGYFV